MNSHSKDLGFEFREVGKLYGNQTALSDVSLTLRQGVNTAILGASGCGKSTLLRILAGILPPTSGEVLWDQTHFSKANQVLIALHRRNLVMVFQDLGIWPNLSVFQNVMMPLSCLNFPKKEQKTKAMEALQLCGIESLYKRKPGEISGGQQQRVVIARAIVLKPAFLLFDEPFSGLDLVTKFELMEEIKNLGSSLGITLILVTHDPIEALYLCQSIVVLRDGQIEEVGDIRKIFEDPKSEILRFFCR